MYKFLILIMLFGGLLWHNSQNIYPYRKGLFLMKEERYEDAKKQFLNIISKKPFLFSARLNIALIHFLQKKKDASLAEYDFVSSESLNKIERFQAYFNSALIEQGAGNIDSSLDFYQKALKDHPASLEVKTNIELMMKQQQSQSSKSQEDKKSDQKNESSKDQKSEQSPSPSENMEKDQTPIEEKDISFDEAQFILKEIENRERKLRSRLENKNTERKNKEGKKW